MKIVTKRIAKGWLAFFALSFVLNVFPLELLAQQGWPQITKETKPWTRWWWMGSAVDEPKPYPTNVRIFESRFWWR